MCLSHAFWPTVYTSTSFNFLCIRTVFSLCLLLQLDDYGLICSALFSFSKLFSKAKDRRIRVLPGVTKSCEQCEYQLFFFLLIDVKAYYSNSMPFITSQPPCHQDIAPSVIEENAIAVALVNEWENEWNQSGLASRLSKEVYG